jgi:hypothetical protein
MEICTENSTNASALTATIVSDYLHSTKSKQERGDITLAAEILKNILQYVDTKKCQTIAKANASYIIEEMQMQDEDLGFDELSKRIMQWNNKENKILLRKIERNESVKFLQQHHMNRTWSEIQCRTYVKMFELIGETIVPKSAKYDGTSFSFEVIRHS